MKSDPLVSIVTPCFNGQRFLREAIESVLSQDYPNIEYLVVDGGSTDGTLELLRSYGDRIRWISERDRGQSDAINKGFRMAKGEIVAWINADDLLLPGAVRHAVAAFAKDPNIAMVYGDGYILEEDGLRRERYPYTEPFDLWRLIWYWDPILQQSTFFRADVVQAAGGIDESLHWGLDWDFFIRLGKQFVIKRIDAEMGAIRVHARTKTSSGGYRRWRELCRIAKRHTGREITPATLMFGLDTFHKHVSARFCGPQSGSLARFAGRRLLTVRGVVAHILWPRLRDAQGWFEDGSAGPVLHLAFPRSDGQARLELFGAATDGQTIEILVNDVTIARKTLSSGRFHLVEMVSSTGELTKVDLRASKVTDERPGGRKISYRLEEAQLVTADGTHVCTPPQVFA